ncbi:Membrane protein involved in the export of O-antigen and teichoic acid [Orenia metallireducens]|uniref:Membrane protein involved in the export of O-antigen and teichoic acid n=1 Tax=Orenia metallireducens TaxID=1413210 RepID=A0A285FVJ3_9FIRM|nr:polysaccharide biosynthesis C-terminal domain-containing protein [Orenia metallireducens]SNY15299.1 Membrane protein involved in the export of O-antigen and teichoic acid [Orenia metallireducens]
MINNIKKFFSNELLNKFGVYFIGKALIAVVNFTLVPVYSRVLAPEEFAIIALIMIFFQISKAVIKLGLESAFSIKFYKYTHEVRINCLYGIYIIYILFTIFLIGITFIDANWISKLLSLNLTLLDSFKIIGIICFSIFVDFFFNLLKMEQNAKFYVFNTVLFTICKVAFLIYFIVILNQGYVSYLNANILSYSLFFIFSLFYILKKYKIRDFVFDFVIMKKLIIIGIPMIPGIIFSMVLASGDQYILKRLGFLASVGVYAMGYKFANAFSSFLIVPFRQALVPVAMKKGNTNITNYKSFLSKVVENFISVLLLCVIALYSFFYQLYSYLIDESYIEGFNIIWVVIIALIIWGVANIISNTLILKEKTYKTLFLTMIATILNIVLNIMWIPKYDIYGAAYATLISYLIVLLLYYFLSQKIILVNYNFKRISIVIIIFIIALSTQNFIDTFKYNSLILILSKTLVLLVVCYLYFRFNIINLGRLRGER